MADPLKLRRAPRCAWLDFVHRLRVGLLIAALILLLGFAANGSV